MSYGIGTARQEEMMYGDADSWGGGPMNGIDLQAEAGMQVGPVAWHANISSDVWTLIIMLGSLGLLWVLGGVVFRKINIF